MLKVLNADLYTTTETIANPSPTISVFTPAVRSLQPTNYIEIRFCQLRNHNKQHAQVSSESYVLFVPWAGFPLA